MIVRIMRISGECSKVRKVVKVSRARSAALRIEILEAAAAEIRKGGYDRTALTAVAASCNFATSAIYNRFPTKEILLETLVAERLESDLGPAVDKLDADLWSEDLTTEMAKPTGVVVNPDLLATLHELELASCHNPAVRLLIQPFANRHLATALAAREVAEISGRVRPDQDPRAQCMLVHSGRIGSHLLGLVSEPPKGGSSTIDHLIRLALLDIPFDTTANTEARVPVRPDPGPSTPDRNAPDAIGLSLLDAGAAIFATEGYHDTTVARISRAAGLTTGALYNRFDGKAGLFNEILLHGIAITDLEDSLDLCTEMATSESIEQSAMLLATLAERDRLPEGIRNRSLRLVARDAARSEAQIAALLAPMQDHLLARMATIFRDSQNAGTMRDDLDPEVLAWWLTSVTYGIWVLKNTITEGADIDWYGVQNSIFLALRTPITRWTG
jgi:AcrR family transcriptional regulator